MSKILLTGMTAAQASPSANNKNLQFAGVLHRVLTRLGHEVIWADPELSYNTESLSSFDSVLVGVSPISSLSANRVYGALNIINLLWGSDKLTLFVDAPGTYQISASLKSLELNPTSLLKQFYSYRKGYKDVLSDISLSSSIYSAVAKLTNEQWPTTIYPKLPWKSDNDIKFLNPKNIYSNFIGLNFDEILLLDFTYSDEKRSKWVVDSYSHKETTKLVKTLSSPISPMKWNKGVSDFQVFDQMLRSLGAIISTHRGDGSWWSYRYVQAFNAKTPVYTDWKETGIIGGAWNFLASAIEDLDISERIIFSDRQKEAYFSALNSFKTETNKLEEILKISKEE
jgi:hypothetical protein